MVIYMYIYNHRLCVYIDFVFLLYLQSSVHQRVINVLGPKFRTIEEAEEEFGLSIDSLMNLEISNKAETPSCTLYVPSLPISNPTKLTPDQLENLTKEGLALLQPHTRAGVLSETLVKFPISNVKDAEQVVFPMVSLLKKEIKTALLDKLFFDLCKSNGILSICSKFVSLSIEAMKVLQMANKPNLVYKWSQCIVGENGVPLIPLNRMPFGLIQYQLQFFTATNVMQVSVFLMCHFIKTSPSQ